MEFLKVVKRRSLWSEVIYILLNILLAFAILGVIYWTKSPLAGFGLFLVSKWRLLAVRPRYWVAHVLSNMVDIIVGLSVVILLYAANPQSLATGLAPQIVIAMLYISWLLLLKPRSKRTYVTAQAGIGLFVGITALMIVSPDWPASLVVLFAWIIGVSTARHVLLAYEEQAYLSLFSLLWGFLVAEITWLGYHWTIAYDMVGTGSIKLPQLTIIITLLGFLTERVYATYNKRGRVKLNDVILPFLLTSSTITLLLILFNAAPNNL